MTRAALLLVGLSLISSPSIANVITPVNQECMAESQAFAYTPELGGLTDGDIDTHAAIAPQDWLQATAGARAGCTWSNAFCDLYVYTTDTQLGRMALIDASSGGDGVATASAAGRDLITFVIDEPLPFSFDCGIGVGTDTPAGTAFASLLFETPNGFQYWETSAEAQEVQISLSGILQPGEYTIAITGQAYAGNTFSEPPGGWGTAVFSYDFQILPEPAAGLMLFLPILVLWRRASART